MCKKLIYLLSLVFVLSMVLTGPAGADPNLMLRLEFEGDANDSSGNDRHGTVTGSLTYGPGVIGQAADLNGSANYVTTPDYNGVLGRNAFSIAAWCLPDSGNDGCIVSWGSTANNSRVEFRSQSDRLRVVTGGGSDQSRNLRGSTIWNQDGEWHHVALTVKENSTGVVHPDMKLYLDGDDDTNLNSSNGTRVLNIVENFPVTIGVRHRDAPSQNLDSWFDDVRIYDKELSWDEIRALAGNVEPLLVGPADEDILAAASTMLEWVPGVYAADVNGHEVYLSDIFEDVNAGVGDPCVLNGSVSQKIVTGLDINKVHYWKVDAVNDSHPDKRWSSEIWSFFVPPYEAYDESPADGAKNVPTDADLFWSAGLGADSHQVYFGTNFNDVNTDSGATPQSDPDYDTGTMAYDTNYYWRIDEFDGSDTHKGAVWTFKTLPDVAITDVNLVCWWTFDEGEDTTAVDWSGHDNHGTLMGDPQWVGGQYGGALEFDADGDCVIREFPEQTYAAFTVALWAKAAVVGRIQYTSVFSSYYPNTAGFQIDVDGGDPGNYRAHPGSGSRLYGPVTTDWVHLVVVGVGTDITLYYNGSEIRTASLDGVEFNQFAVGLNRNREADKFFDGMIDDVRIYDKALTDAEVRAISGVDLEKAWKPRPADSETDVPMTPTLMWEPGDYAPGTNGHKVYFGADDPTNMVLVSTPAQPQTPNEYDPGTLDLGTTYYWKIDEVNNGGADAGDTWSFTVIEYLVVDDFEEHTPTEMWKVWMDGAGDCDGNDTDSGAILYEDTVTTYGGSAGSMKYDYNNIGTVGTHPCVEVGGPLTRPKYSRAVAKIADLPSGIDPNWLAGSPKALALMFQGIFENDPNEEMWLELTDDSGKSAKVTYGPPHLGEDDINDVNETSWHQWNIDLQEFVDGGVDLSEVNSIAIGFGNPGETPTAGWGYGTMYIDDIRLYTTRCVLDKRDPNFAKFDYRDGNCEVNARELDWMFRDWLDYDYTVYATPPSGANLAAHWEFEGDFNDSSVNGHDGDPCGGATIFKEVTRDSNVLSLDGIDDYVNITGYQGILGGASRTVCMWINTADAGGTAPNGRALIGWGTNATGQRWGLAVNKQDAGGRIVDALRINVNGGTRTGTTVLTDSTWHHVAAVQLDDGSPNANEVQLYVDGAEETYSQSQGRAINTTANIDVRIGWSTKPADLPNFGGLIDDVRIYDYALSAAEVMSIAGVAEVYYELTSVANVYDEEAKNSKVVNFKDYALLVNEWLEKDLFPPEGAD